MRENRKVFLWVEGPFGAFTDPMFKSDGTSYACITPTAAKGLAENIFAKPEMSWRVDRIVVVNPIRYLTVLRNYQQEKIKDESPMTLSSDNDPFYSPIQQCHTRILKNIAYRIEYSIFLTKELINPKLTIDKYFGQIRDRLKKGQCFAYPYFGCKEFTCSIFRESTKEESNYSFIHQELIHAGEISLGRMPILNYSDENGKFQTIFKEVSLNKGVIDVKHLYP